MAKMWLRETAVGTATVLGDIKISDPTKLYLSSTLNFNNCLKR